MSADDNNYPVVAEGERIKLKTEKMDIDQLYHCIYDNKVFLFFKDDEAMLHCYEVENPAAVKEIAENPSELQSILKRYAHIDKGQP
jgi:hypothetical protein